MKDENYIQTAVSLLVGDIAVTASIRLGEELKREDLLRNQVTDLKEKLAVCQEQSRVENATISKLQDEISFSNSTIISLQSEFNYARSAAKTERDRAERLCLALEALKNKSHSPPKFTRREVGEVVEIPQGMEAVVIFSDGTMLGCGKFSATIWDGQAFPVVAYLLVEEIK